MRKLFPWLPFLILTAIFIAVAFYEGTILGFHSGAISFELNRMGGVGAVFKGPINYVVDGAVGSPVNLFYPWLIYSLSYPIGFACNSFIIGYMILFALITYLTLTIAYLVVKKVTGNAKQGFLFSVFWTFAAYHAFDVVQRNATGEALAYTFLPLAFFGLSQIIRKRGDGWWGLSFGLTLITYTHAVLPLVVIVYVFIVIAVFYKWIPDRKATLLGIVKALGLTILTTAFYWVPMVEQSWAVKSQPGQHFDLTVEALNPVKVLVNSITNNIGAYGIGLVALILLVWAFLRWNKLDGTHRTLLVLGTVSLVLATGVIPWNSLRALTGSALQLPGMIMMLATMLIVYVGSYVIASYHSDWLNWGSAVLAVGIFVVSVMSLQLASPQSDRVTYHNEANLVGFYNVDDYFPTKSINHLQPLLQNQFTVNGKQKTVTRDSFGNRVKFSIGKGRVNTPILYAKGISVTVNGKQVDTRMTKWGTVAFTSPAKNSRIVVTSRYTPLAKIAAIVSIVSLIVTISLLVYGYEKRE